MTAHQFTFLRNYQEQSAMSTDNQTLQQLLAERVTAFANGDRPREIIDKAVEAMFVDVIKDAFRSYGDLGKAVQEAIKAAMPANVGDVFELTKYNALIGEALKQRWHQSAVESTLLERATAAIDEVMSPEFITGEVSLRKLFEAFIEAHKEQAVEERWERPEIRFRDETIGNSPYLHIYFDETPESERSRYRGEHELEHARSTSKKRSREPVSRHHSEQLKQKTYPEAAGSRQVRLPATRSPKPIPNWSPRPSKERLPVTMVRPH